MVEFTHPVAFHCITFSFALNNKFNITKILFPSSSLSSHMASANPNGDRAKRQKLNYDLSELNTLVHKFHYQHRQFDTTHDALVTIAKLNQVQSNEMMETVQKIQQILTTKW